MLQLPNAFTPNADGLNDLFGPQNNSGAAMKHFRVFNRYGQTVFEGSVNKLLWDGTYKGIEQAPGSYLWTMEYMDPSSMKTISQRGTVQLIR